MKRDIQIEIENAQLPLFERGEWWVYLWICDTTVSCRMKQLEIDVKFSINRNWQFTQFEKKKTERQKLARHHTIIH